MVFIIITNNFINLLIEVDYLLENSLMVYVMNNYCNLLVSTENICLNLTFYITNIYLNFMVFIGDNYR